MRNKKAELSQRRPRDEPNYTPIGYVCPEKVHRAVIKLGLRNLINDQSITIKTVLTINRWIHCQQNTVIGDGQTTKHNKESEIRAAD